MQGQQGKQCRQRTGPIFRLRLSYHDPDKQDGKHAGYGRKEPDRESRVTQQEPRYIGKHGNRWWYRMISPGHVVPQVYVHECIPLQFVAGIGKEMKQQFNDAERQDQPPGPDPG